MEVEQQSTEVEATAPAAEEAGAVPAKSSQPADEFQWYAVQVMARYEKTARQKLFERMEEDNLSHMLKEVLIPSEEVIELKSGQKKKVERLLFPGYIMVHMKMDSESWTMVRRTPNVKGFIGAEAHQPLPLTEEEMSKILARIAPKEDSEIKTETIFEPGETVRIIEGPFADFSGTVEAVNSSKSSLRVTIVIFGRMTPTEVSFKQVVREWA